MLLTNYSPYFLTFSSPNIDPKRFFALYTSLGTSFMLFETLVFLRPENDSFSRKCSCLPTTWHEVLVVHTQGKWLLVLQDKS
jgi:hypothetical protein